MDPDLFSFNTALQACANGNRNASEALEVGFKRLASHFKTTPT